MKFAFVTGANRGLGLGFVDYLSTHGYFVFAGVRRITPELVSSDRVEYVLCDVGNDKQLIDCEEKVRTKTDHLDLIINNAGINKDSATGGHKESVCTMGRLKRENLLSMFDINSISPILVTQEFLPLLTSNPSFIINISSDRASYHDEFENSSANYGYRASKAALNMFTFCSTTDLPVNIKTFAVHPGDVHTDMNPQGDHTPLEQAEKIMAITENWNDNYNGRFMRWSGEFYPL